MYRNETVSNRIMRYAGNVYQEPYISLQTFRGQHSVLFKNKLFAVFVLKMNKYSIIFALVALTSVSVGCFCVPIFKFPIQMFKLYIP